MIPPVPGWTWDVVEGSLYLVPPDGLAAGGLQYTERVRPMLELEARARTMPTPDDYVVTAIGAPLELTTAEGERASMLVVHGTQAGAEVVRVIGAVDGDDYQSVLVGVARSAGWIEAMPALVRDLLVRDRHFLGVRRRRVRHAAPAGWRTYQAPPYHVHHVATDGATIEVHPATPTPDDPAFADDAIAGWLHDHEIADVTIDEPIAVTTRHGMAGEALAIRGRRGTRACHVRVILLCDDRYVVPIFAAGDEPLTPHDAAIAALVDSIAPIPGRPRPTRAWSALQHWAE